MAATALIRPLPDDRWSWHGAGAADGAPVTGSGSLAAAAEQLAAAPVTLLVPGTDLLLTRVRLPVRSRSRARAAVPWALEDRLAEEVEALHFALGAMAADEWPVAVMARERLAAWLADCAAAGLEVQAAIPEPLALPAPVDGRWQVLVEDHCVTVRTGRTTGFACEPELLEVVAGAEEPPEGIDCLQVNAGEGAHWPPALADMVAASTERVTTPFAAFRGVAEAPVNLLQGSFSRTEKRLQMLRQWRLPAGLAAGLLAVGAVQGVLGYMELGQRQAELQQRIQSVFQEAFPEARATRDPRTQMETRLRAMRGEGRSDSRFGDMLLRAGAVVNAQEGAELTALTWREGMLEVDVEAAALADLDAIQRGLGARGLPAELRSVDRRDDDRVSGRLRVTEGAS